MHCVVQFYIISGFDSGVDGCVMCVPLIATSVVYIWNIYGYKVYTTGMFTYTNPHLAIRKSYIGNSVT